MLWAQVWDSAAAEVRHTYAHGCVQALCLRCSYSAAANPPTHTHTLPLGCTHDVATPAHRDTHTAITGSVTAVDSAIC